MVPIQPHDPTVLVQCAQTNNWVAIGLPALQLVASIAQIGLVAWLTLFTFRRTERQRIEERRAAFFHTLIIDGGLKALRESFAAIRIKLEDAAQDLDSHRTFWAGQKIDEFISETATEYSVTLSKAMRTFALRVNVMDPKLARSITEHCDDLENQVTEWFRTSARRQGFEHCESLPDILIEGENKVYTLIHQTEFGT